MSKGRAFLQAVLNVFPKLNLDVAMYLPYQLQASGCTFSFFSPELCTREYNAATETIIKMKKIARKVLKNAL
jgi:hypothetical protein